MAEPARCPRRTRVYGPRGARETLRCTGPRGHDGPHTYSFVPGRTGTYSFAVEDPRDGGKNACVS